MILAHVAALQACDCCVYDGGDGDGVAAVHDGHHEFHVAIVYVFSISVVDLRLILHRFQICFLVAVVHIVDEL